MRKISAGTVRRLSLYLRHLEQAHAQGSATVSSSDLASLGGTTPAQVRRDFSTFGSFGKRGLGYSVTDLIGQIRGILGLGQQYRVVVVGVGSLGSALARYSGFRERGFEIVALYDSDPRRVGAKDNGSPVRDVRELPADLRRNPADIGIVATPPEAAQSVAEVLAASGVTAILNFAPTSLQVRKGVVVRTVNMASELEALSFALRNRDTLR
jgi:redox-sensing transcriptional repressor